MKLASLFSIDNLRVVNRIGLIAIYIKEDFKVDSLVLNETSDPHIRLKDVNIFYFYHDLNKDNKNFKKIYLSDFIETIQIMKK